MKETWNYVVSVNNPTTVSHSCVGNFTAPQQEDLPHPTNLIIGKSTRIEIHLITRRGLGLQLMLDVPIYGRIAALELFRHKDGKQDQGGKQDLLFIATERLKFCVLQWDASSSGVITRAVIDVSDRLRCPAVCQICIIDPDCRLIGLHLYDGFFKVIPFDKNGLLEEPLNIRLEELQVLDIKFLYDCEKPTIAVLYEDLRGGHHVKTYEVLLEETAFTGGPSVQNNPDSGDSLLIPVTFATVWRTDYWIRNHCLLSCFKFFGNPNLF